MTQPGPCVICGATDYPLSMGGPTICPSCDCGNFGPEVLQKQSKAFTEIVARLQADNERLTTALTRIEQWANAYPVTIFPEPDLKRAHELLQAGGMTLDAVSANAMRHVLSGVGTIVRAALAEKEPELRYFGEIPL